MVITFPNSQEKSKIDQIEVGSNIAQNHLCDP